MTTTFGNILTVLWEMLPDEWANHPGVWWKIMDTIPLDPQCKNAMLQLIGRWSKNYKQWSTGSLPALKKKIGKTADTMCQMSLPANQLDELKGLAKRMAERAGNFRRGLILISIHSDQDSSAHVHTIHSCAYANRSCRCYFKAFPEAQEDARRLLRKPPPIETFKRSDWENITKYFCTKGRRATFAKINGAIQRLPLEITNLSDIILSGQVEGGSHSGLENCHDPLDNNDERKRGIEPKGDGGTRSRKRRGVGNAGGDGGIRGDTGVILDLIKRYAVCPLSEIVYTREYLENPIAVKRLDDRDVKNAIDCPCCYY
jgi:hypothetical protein